MILERFHKNERSDIRFRSGELNPDLLGFSLGYANDVKTRYDSHYTTPDAIDAVMLQKILIYP